MILKCMNFMRAVRNTFVGTITNPRQTSKRYDKPETDKHET